MARKIFFTSFKGGTGVTTVCIGLGLALSEYGERTLLVDGDRLSAGAMVAAGLGNMQVYTLADYEKSACRAKQTVLYHPKSPNLGIMPSIGLKDLKVAAAAIKDVEGLFDFVLLDRIAPECADESVIVTEPYLPSLKSADACRSALADGGFKNIYLFIDKLNGGQVLAGETMDGGKISETLGLGLLGVTPDDPGVGVGKWRKRTFDAFRVAARNLLCGNAGLYDVTREYSGAGGFLRRKLRAKL